MELITQTPGHGLAASLRPVLMRLDLLVRRQHSQYALSRAQTSILNTLASHGRLRMSELARLENVRVPTTSNAVTVIESLGYVERLPDSADRRGVCVHLTDSGRARIAQVLEARDRDMGAHIDALAPAHRDALAAAVPALNALIDAFDPGPDDPEEPTGPDERDERDTVEPVA